MKLINSYRNWYRDNIINIIVQSKDEVWFTVSRTRLCIDARPHSAVQARSPIDQHSAANYDKF